MPQARMAFMLVLGSFLFACSESEHTIDWYKEHKAERDEKIKWCSYDTARMLKTDCMNADKAQTLIVVDPKTPRAADTFKVDATEARKALGLDKEKPASQAK